MLTWSFQLPIVTNGAGFIHSTEAILTLPSSHCFQARQRKHRTNPHDRKCLKAQTRIGFGFIGNSRNVVRTGDADGFKVYMDDGRNPAGVTSG